MGTLLGVGDIHRDRIAHAHPHEGPGNRVVEGPEPIGAAVTQAPLDLGGQQIHRDVLRATPAHRRADVGRIMSELRHLAGIRRFGLTHDHLAEHPRRLVAWQGTKVFENAILVSAEHDRCRGALADDVIGLGVEFGNGDVVHGAIAINQIDLHHGAFGHLEIRVDHIGDLTGGADEHQLAVGNGGTQRKGNIRSHGHRFARRRCRLGRIRSR